jgi:OOP family OmpA-OmpF porin
MRGLLLIICFGLVAGAGPRADAKPEQRKLIAHGIQFKTGTAKIHKASLPTLDGVAKTMKRNKKIMVRIEVHTDSTGSSRYNRRISQERANAIAKYLVSKGVKARRLDPKGYGEDKPIADNKTAAGRAKNRRVELVIVDE